jgi:hypothetical protein
VYIHTTVRASSALSGIGWHSGAWLCQIGATVPTTVQMSASALVALARFGHKFVTDGDLGTVAPGTAAAVRLPPDRVPQVWQIRVIGRGARVRAVA